MVNKHVWISHFQDRMYLVNVKMDPAFLNYEPDPWEDSKKDRSQVSLQFFFFFLSLVQSAQPFNCINF